MISALFLASALAAPALAAPSVPKTPNVSLLTDLPLFPKTGPLAIKALLPIVSIRKNSTFHFGSTYDIYDWQNHTTFHDMVYDTVFNHMVAENGCKWFDTEQVRGQANLTDCRGVLDYAGAHGDSFRGHNTFWHQQTPDWLPGNVSASDLVNNVIPQHVQQTISGIGKNVTSWDVMNELIGDNTTAGMTALECVQVKNAWPTSTFDGSGVPLVKDLSFVHAAYKQAYKTAASNIRLSYNDYSTGGQDNKTACVFELLEDIHKNAGVPYNRLAIGFQSHVTAAPGGSFVAKADLAKTFKKLAGMGVDAYVTEIDIRRESNTTADIRYQAAIWGDYLDTCLYASNCKEFVNWDTRDDESWLRDSGGAGTLFDQNGKPKLAVYELQARFARYILGRPELCATALGSKACTAEY